MKNSIRVYNTLTGKKDSIKPLKGKHIHLFVCGPTVYDFSHIGHARTYIFFDCFVRYLKSKGFTVFYLQNITDVDDKIIQRAREKGVAPHDLAHAFLNEHLKDMKALGIATVKKYAKATDYISEIVSQVKRLLEQGYAYTLDDGIYFDISKVKSYGKLSRRTALQAEDSVSRIDYSKHKKNRGDFALWKFSPEGGEHGEPSWPASFGAGRPGWHIEDTAITEKFFGAQYDIHGGARDLIFPHHEAEVTQMEALSGKKPMARYWMHTGFLTTGDQKMSKSLGNGITISQFLKRYRVEEMRFWIAKNLWRSPLNYSESTMIEVKSSLGRIEEFVRKIKNLSPGKTAKNNIKLYKKYCDDFWKALADDFNTPKAFAAVFDLIKKVNTILDNGLLSKKDAKMLFAFFEELDEIFGIIDFAKLKKQNIPSQVLELVAQRQEMRKKLDWQKADELRLEIETYGYTIEDTPHGAVLKKIL